MLCVCVGDVMDVVFSVCIVMYVLYVVRASSGIWSTNRASEDHRDMSFSRSLAHMLEGVRTSDGHSFFL